MLTDVTALSADQIAEQQIFGGAITVQSRVRTGVPIVAIRPNAVAAEPAPAPGPAVVEAVGFTVSDAAKGAPFAVATGLLVYPQAAHLEHFKTGSKRFPMNGTGGGYFARVGQWLRESF